MLPVVFKIPGLNWSIPGFGVMMMIAFLFAIWWAARRAEKSRANPEVILNCGFVALIAGVVGCRGMYVWHNWSQFSHVGGTLATLWAIIDVSQGGLEFYGGFILSAILVPLWLIFVERVSLRWYMDIIAPSAVVGLAFGRIGCFLNGCCYGAVCTLPWAMTFPYASPVSSDQFNLGVASAAYPKELIVTHTERIIPFGLIDRMDLVASDGEIASAQRAEDDARAKVEAARAAHPNEPKNAAVLSAEAVFRAARNKHGEIRANMKKYGVSARQIRDIAAQHRSLPVHPTQLYSAITAGLIAILLNALYWRRKRDGQVILMLLLIEPVTRIVLDAIRTDNPIEFTGLTISQEIGIILSIIGAVGLLALRALPPRSPRAKEWFPDEADVKTAKV